MRLNIQQIRAIKAAVQTIDADAEVKLFGSRVDDEKVGGDIDLLINSRTMGWREVAKLRGILEMNLGEQKIEVVLKPREEPSFIQMIETECSAFMTLQTSSQHAQIAINAHAQILNYCRKY